jgi:peptidoglycan/xylan/chitin deacetylase (PgdA/CDA1 family)
MSINDNNVRKGRARKSRKKYMIRRTIVFSIMVLLMLGIGFVIGKKMVQVQQKSVIAASSKQNVENNKSEISPDRQADDEYKNRNEGKEKGIEINSKEVENIKEITDKDNVSENFKENNIQIEENYESENNNSENTNEEDNGDIDKNKKQDNSSVSKYVQKFADEKICYLTFDDGPTSNITPQVLDVLKKYDIRVTFFVIGEEAEKYPKILKRAKAEGHYIANHTYSHNYDYLYSNPNNLISDIKKCNEVLKDIIGETTNIVRFPGGSFNMPVYQRKVNEAGYHFVDWNCLNGDAEALNIPPASLIERVKTSMQNQKHITVLMHDAATKQTTVQALPKIIEYIQSQGYQFKTLDEAFDD